MQKKSFSLLFAMFSALSFLYRVIFGLRRRKYGSSNREFTIWNVRYTERIYKTFVRAKQKEMTSVRKIEMFVISEVCNI